MKKIFLSFALLTGLAATAQLPAGSLAKDFTLTDINGVSHNLYTYLDQGKTVFLDVSATWCGPCWQYHNTHAFDDLWTNHGLAGGTGVSASTTDDVMVIFIEGDGSTDDAALHGGSGSQGDWTANVEHPIIDLASGAEADTFNAHYAIQFFPTIYRICPNRIVTEVGQLGATQLYDGVAECPAPASNSVDVKAHAYKGNPSVCGPISYTPSVQIQNNGLDPLTNATITITMNGSTVSTGTYTGNLATYGLAIVTCSAIPNFSGGNLTITVTTNNDADVANNGLTSNVIGAVETSSKILLTVMTDDYPNEVTWNIKNASEQVVSGTTNPSLAVNTNYDLVYQMPSMGCYTFNITDTYGDGIAFGTINVRDHDGTVLLNDQNYGFGKSVAFKVTEMVASINEYEVSAFNVYPNPSNGIVYINSEHLSQYKTIELTDATGRVIANWKVKSTVMSLDVNAIDNGNYILVFKGDAKNAIQKIQINK